MRHWITKKVIKGIKVMKVSFKGVNTVNWISDRTHLRCVHISRISEFDFDVFQSQICEKQPNY